LFWYVTAFLEGYFQLHLQLSRHPFVFIQNTVKKHVL
jgi:hypothetical protein